VAKTLNYRHPYARTKAVQPVEQQPPQPAKPKIKKAEYRTAWFLQKLTEIDKQIYDCVTRTMKETRAFTNKQLLAKYVAFNYLTAARRIEPFLKPPTLTRFKEQGMRLIKVNKINAKHFTKTGKRMEMQQVFLPLNRYEESLWQFVMDSKELATIDFMPLLSATAPERTRGMAIEDREAYVKPRLANLTTSIKDKFKADITNGETLSHEGLRPHMLKHIRAYDLKAKGNKDELVMALLGWDSADMLYSHYIDLQRMMQVKEQVGMYAATFGDKERTHQS